MVNEIILLGNRRSVQKAVLNAPPKKSGSNHLGAPRIASAQMVFNPTP